MPVLHAAHCMSHAICRMLHAVCCNLLIACCMPAIAQLSVKRHLQHWPEHRPSPKQEQLQTHRQTRSAITSALESGTAPSLSAYVANGAPARTLTKLSKFAKEEQASRLHLVDYRRQLRRYRVHAPPELHPHLSPRPNGPLAHVRLRRRQQCLARRRRAAQRSQWRSTGGLAGALHAAFRAASHLYVAPGGASSGHLVLFPHK